MSNDGSTGAVPTPEMIKSAGDQILAHYRDEDDRLTLLVNINFQLERVGGLAEAMVLAETIGSGLGRDQTIAAAAVMADLASCLQIVAEKLRASAE